jgi:hypothetical protein
MKMFSKVLDTMSFFSERQYEQLFMNMHYPPPPILYKAIYLHKEMLKQFHT